MLTVCLVITLNKLPKRLTMPQPLVHGGIKFYSSQSVCTFINSRLIVYVELTWYLVPFSGLSYVYFLLVQTLNKFLHCSIFVKDFSSCVSQIDLIFSLKHYLDELYHVSPLQVRHVFTSCLPEGASLSHWNIFSIFHCIFL